MRRQEDQLVQVEGQKTKPVGHLWENSGLSILRKQAMKEIRQTSTDKEGRIPFMDKTTLKTGGI